MRILQVIDSLATGGAERLLVDLCPIWRDHGFETDIYVLKRCHSGFEEELRQSGINIFGEGHGSIYSPLHIVHLLRHLRRRSYDLVHVHLYPAQLWVTAIRDMFPEITFISTEHSTENRRRKPLFKLIDRWMYSRFDLVTCISSGVRHSLTEWIGSGTCETVVLTNGVRLERFSGARLSREEVFGNNSPAVLCIASLNEGKDHATLIRAAKQAPGVHFWLAGEGPLHRDLENLAKEEQVSDQVHFLGVRSDVHRLIAAADLYVQPSRIEGFGLGAVEAMAGGLPIVCTNVSGLREVVEGAALLFNPGDYQTLAQHIGSLIADADVRNVMGAAARQQAQFFSLESTAAAFMRIYERFNKLSPNSLNIYDPVVSD